MSEQYKPEVEKVQRLPYLTCDQVDRYKRLMIGAAQAPGALALAGFVVFCLHKMITADHTITYCYITTNTHTSTIPGVPDKQSYNLYGNREWAADSDIMVKHLSFNNIRKVAEDMGCPLK